jgi:hypothetical protein
MDNTVALGLASGQMDSKRSKAMDMRFFWLGDRVEQPQFVVAHIPGIWNIADHFTKPAYPKQNSTNSYPTLSSTWIMRLQNLKSHPRQLRF